YRKPWLPITASPSSPAQERGPNDVREGQLARPTLAEHADRLVDAALPCLGGLGALDLEHMPPLLAVRQALEEALGIDVAVEGLREVSRHLHLARLGVQLELHVHLVARRQAGGLAVLGTDREHEHAAHARHRAAIGV